MLNDKKIVVVLPAYNAARTLEPTYGEIPFDIIDSVVLVDDKSVDDTVEIARRLNIDTTVHERNKGYGGNQKTCYEQALKLGADIVIMLHPDYQYTPRLLTAMAAMIAYGEYDAVLGSRILGKGAMRGGMPLYKYIANRVLTLLQNLLLGEKFSEYHTGYRAFSRRVLEVLPLENNSNDFIFDNQMIVQMVYFDLKIGEISCPTRYTAESSSISFQRSVKYGFGVIIVSCQYLLQRYCGCSFRIFSSRSKS